MKSVESSLGDIHRTSNEVSLCVFQILDNINSYVRILFVFISKAHLVSRNLKLNCDLVLLNVMIDDCAACLTTVVSDVNLLFRLQLNVDDTGEAIANQLRAAKVVDAAAFQGEHRVWIEAHRIASIRREIDAVLIVLGRCRGLDGVNASGIVQTVLVEGTHPHSNDGSFRQALTG